LLAAVKGDVLAWRDGTLWLIKSHQKRAIGSFAHMAVLICLAIADLCAALHRPWRGRKPIHITSPQPVGLQVGLILCDVKRIGHMLFAHDIPGFFGSASESAELDSLSLAQRVLM
jgi:hypothetical protein